MSQAIMQRQTTKGPSAWEVTLANTKLWLKSPTPYLNALGLVAFVLFWYLTTEYFQLPYFEKLPGPVASFQEWVSKDPIYGISIYTSDYYAHIGISVWRVFQAFMLATLLGVPTGLFMGWNKTFKDYSFPLLETLRPIPMLAWVPLAILMWPGREASIVFLTFLGSYFATVLNTLLGVEPSTNPISARPAHSVHDPATYSSRSSCPAPCRSSSPAFRSAWGMRGSRWSRAKCSRANTASATSSGTRSCWCNTP